MADPDTVLDDPNALWRAVHGYVSTSPDDVRRELWAQFTRVFALRADHDSALNAVGHRLMTRAAFALYVDAREGVTYPLASLFCAPARASSAQREPVKLSRARNGTAMDRFRARWLGGEA